MVYEVDKIYMVQRWPVGRIRDTALFLAVLSTRPLTPRTSGTNNKISICNVLPCCDILELELSQANTNVYFTRCRHSLLFQERDISLQLA